MRQKTHSIKDKAKPGLDIEEEFQDTTRANAKKSEPARTPRTQNANIRDLKKGGTTSDKKI